MSRNAKNFRNNLRAKAASASRKAGNPGPKQTTPKHGKVAARRSPNNRYRGPARPAVVAA